MKIEHIALWTNDIEKLKDFYTKYFDAKSGALYHNPVKKFSSYFLSFDSGTRLEIMTKPSLYNSLQEYKGLAHFAFSAGSRKAVDDLTAKLKSDGYTIAGEPRTTGDGYYESVVLDPDGNRIEITV